MHIDRKPFLYILCWIKNLYLSNRVYILSINNIVNYSISLPTFIAIFYYYFLIKECYKLIA
ncbi:hypothetical protein DN393_20820 [Bacillus sp. BPN334]|nr:hypothetical protein DN393_20820 [Bacillus sp. BPN334]